MKKKEGILKIKGKVLEVLPNYKFRIKTFENKIITAYASGKIKKNHIRILNGDTVIVEISIHDKKNGRIIYRYI
ncbi:translation initiation factor IF-1 [Candidatus Zinderia insecticola CARI]|uniref:Translation initiation factor IF-1 n=1 Tax=Zinderia insecticola (strain CARI) TaxID=871271 RepID=E0TIL3_ZINIC|nr:translation initiation factor IF-1 [Candidatus Zinderia insecticola CARI]